MGEPLHGEAGGAAELAAVRQAPDAPEPTAAADANDSNNEVTEESNTNTSNNEEPRSAPGTDEDGEGKSTDAEADRTTPEAEPPTKMPTMRSWNDEMDSDEDELAPVDSGDSSPTTLNTNASPYQPSDTTAYPRSELNTDATPYQPLNSNAEPYQPASTALNGEAAPYTPVAAGANPDAAPFEPAEATSPSHPPPPTTVTYPKLGANPDAPAFVPPTALPPTALGGKGMGHQHHPHGHHHAGHHPHHHHHHGHRAAYASSAYDPSVDPTGAVDPAAAGGEWDATAAGAYAPHPHGGDLAYKGGKQGGGKKGAAAGYKGSAPSSYYPHSGYETSQYATGGQGMHDYHDASMAYRGGGKGYPARGKYGGGRKGVPQSHAYAEAHMYSGAAGSVPPSYQNPPPAGLYSGGKMGGGYGMKGGRSRYAETGTEQYPPHDLVHTINPHHHTMPTSMWAGKGGRDRHYGGKGQPMYSEGDLYNRIDPTAVHNAQTHAAAGAKGGGKGYPPAAGYHAQYAGGGYPPHGGKGMKKGMPPGAYPPHAAHEAYPPPAAGYRGPPPSQGGKGAKGGMPPVDPGYDAATPAAPAPGSFDAPPSPYAPRHPDDAGAAPRAPSQPNAGGDYSAASGAEPSSGPSSSCEHPPSSQPSDDESMSAGVSQALEYFRSNVLVKDYSPDGNANPRSEDCVVAFRRFLENAKAQGCLDSKFRDMCNIFSYNWVGVCHTLDHKVVSSFLTTDRTNAQWR